MSGALLPGRQDETQAVSETGAELRAGGGSVLEPEDERQDHVARQLDLSRRPGDRLNVIALSQRLGERGREPLGVRAGKVAEEDAVLLEEPVEIGDERADVLSGPKIESGEQAIPQRSVLILQQ